MALSRGTIIEHVDFVWYTGARRLASRLYSAVILEGTVECVLPRNSLSLRGRGCWFSYADLCYLQERVRCMLLQENFTLRGKLAFEPRRKELSR